MYLSASWQDRLHQIVTFERSWLCRSACPGVRSLFSRLNSGPMVRHATFFTRAGHGRAEEPDCPHAAPAPDVSSCHSRGLLLARGICHEDPLCRQKPPTLLPAVSAGSVIPAYTEFLRGLRIVNPADTGLARDLGCVQVGNDRKERLDL